MITAKEYWKKRFNEYPKTDSDKLAVAMMAEYAEEINKEIKELREKLEKSEHTNNYYDSIKIGKQA